MGNNLKENDLYHDIIDDSFECSKTQIGKLLLKLNLNIVLFFQCDTLDGRTRVDHRVLNKCANLGLDL